MESPNKLTTLEQFIKQHPDTLSWRSVIPYMREMGLDCRSEIEGINSFWGSITYSQKMTEMCQSIENGAEAKKKQVRKEDIRNFWVCWDDTDAICFKFFDIVCKSDAFWEIINAFSRVENHTNCMPPGENVLYITTSLSAISNIKKNKESTPRKVAVVFSLFY